MAGKAILKARDVFPTHVGMNRSILTRPKNATCIPHTRGDEPQVAADVGGLETYSPHTWG